MLFKKALLGTATAVVLLVAATAALAATYTGTADPDVINGSPMADTITLLAHLGEQSDDAGLRGAANAVHQSLKKKSTAR